VKRYFPNHPPTGIIPKHGKDEQRLRAYLEDILSGELKVGGPWNPSAPIFSTESSRVCVKIHNAKHWVSWFGEEFDANLVLLTRHPISQSLSTIDRGWLRLVDLYLEDPELRSRVDAAVGLDFVSNILDEGTRLQRYVLNWAVENFIPLSAHHAGTEIDIVTYEELVLDFEETIRVLADRLAIEDVSGLLEHEEQLSRTASSGAEQILATNENTSNRKEALLHRRLDQVSQDEIDRCFEILDAFGLEIYTRDSPLPVSRCRLATA